jgi:hypothetical protein
MNILKVLSKEKYLYIDNKEYASPNHNAKSVLQPLISINNLIMFLYNLF